MLNLEHTLHYVVCLTCSLLFSLVRGVNSKLCGIGEVDCASVCVCVWTLTVIARFDVAGSNCLSCEHERGVFGKHWVERE